MILRLFLALEVIHLFFLRFFTHVDPFHVFGICLGFFFLRVAFVFLIHKEQIQNLWLPICFKMAGYFLLAGQIYRLGRDADYILIFELATLAVFSSILVVFLLRQSLSLGNKNTQ